MYGEEFDLTSNPIAEENGFAIESDFAKVVDCEKIMDSLSILQMITKDLAANPSFRSAA